MRPIKNRGRWAAAILAMMLVLISGCGVDLSQPSLPPDAVLPESTATPVIAPTATAAAPAPTETISAAVLLELPVVEGVAGERSIGDPYIPELGNTGYDVQQYTLRMTLDPARAHVDAHVTITSIATIDHLAQISLDFVGFDIEELSLDGSRVDYERQERKLIVNLTEPLAVGELFGLDIIYRGEPIFETSPFVPFISHLGMQFPGQREGGSLFVVAEPDGARYWFPCNDHPRDKALFRFELGVPEGQVGAANGLLIERRTGVPAIFEDGSPGDVFVWESADPMATYLATVVVGNYVRLEGQSPDGVPLRHYVFPEQVTTFQRQNERIGEMVDWMSDLLGGYPFEAFGFAAVRGSGVSLETQTLVILDERAGEYIMAHELAHMWFGNWVSLHTWGDMWRNEGFATYFGMLWVTRNDPAAFNEFIDGLRESYADYQPAFPLDQPPPQALFGRDSYMRGALLVHELRTLVGDDAFFDGLRAYFERYGGGTASHEAFQGVMEAASGMDLDMFFQAWFH
jgi:aminopeptidase N